MSLFQVEVRLQVREPSVEKVVELLRSLLDYPTVSDVSFWPIEVPDPEEGE